MSDQPKALWIADQLDSYNAPLEHKDWAREIRRLYYLNEKMLQFVEEYIEAWDNGVAGDSYLLRMANRVIAEAEKE